MSRCRLLVCTNPIGSNKPSCGGDRGSEALVHALEDGIRQRGLDAEVARVHCLNRCLRGPAMRIAPGGRFFLEVTERDVPEILDVLADTAGIGESEDGLDFGGGVPGA